MATYYIRTPANGGSDSNAGTSTTTAWATFGKAFSASGFTSGDTVYVEPGVYRETVSALNTSPTSRAYVIGDYSGAIFGTVGEVRWTGWLTTDDATSTTTTLLDTNNRDYITIRGIRFDSVSRNINIGGGSQFIDIEDCVFVSQTNGCVAITTPSTAGLSSDCNIRRCVFFGLQDPIFIVPNLAVSNITANINIENCTITSLLQRGIFFSVSGGTTTVASGFTVKNCTITAPTGISVTASRYAANAVVVTNCLFYLCATGINAGTAGQCSEDYNRFGMVVTPTSNITTNGANSILGGNPLIDFGSSFMFDTSPRMPWYMPTTSGIILGDGTATGMPTDDIHGTTRPSPPAVGASEKTTLYTSGLAVNPLGGFVG